MQSSLCVEELHWVRATLCVQAILVFISGSPNDDFMDPIASSCIILL